MVHIIHLNVEDKMKKIKTLFLRKYDKNHYGDTDVSDSEKTI